MDTRGPALQASSASLWWSPTARHKMRACPEKLGTVPGPGCCEKSNLLVREPEDSAVTWEEAPACHQQPQRILLCADPIKQQSLSTTAVVRWGNEEPGPAASPGHQ